MLIELNIYYAVVEIVEMKEHKSHYARTHPVKRKDGKTYIKVEISKEVMEEPGVLAHEFFHVVQFLFEFIGLPLNRESSEAYAYLLQYLLDSYFENINS